MSGRVAMSEETASAASYKCSDLEGQAKLLFMAVQLDIEADEREANKLEGK